MITERARVVAVDRCEVWVETIRQSTCQSCSARNGCGQRLLNQLGGGKSHILKIACGPNHGFQVDDYAEIAVPDGMVLKYSLIVYMLPIVGFVAGSFLTSTYFASGDFAAVLGAILGGSLGFYGARRYNSRVEADPQRLPRLVQTKPHHSCFVAAEVVKVEK